MRVWAKSLHIYYDAEAHTEYRIEAGTWRELPDWIGQLIIAAHPGKLFALEVGQDAPGDIRTVIIDAPPFDRQMKRRGRPPNTRGEMVGR